MFIVQKCIVSDINIIKKSIYCMFTTFNFKVENATRICHIANYKFSVLVFISDLPKPKLPSYHDDVTTIENNCQVHVEIGTALVATFYSNIKKSAKPGIHEFSFERPVRQETDSPTLQF